MAIKFVDEADLTTVGNAIRAKTGGTGLLTFPAGMAEAIAGISGGGGGSSDFEIGGCKLLYGTFTPASTITTSYEIDTGDYGVNHFGSSKRRLFMLYRNADTTDRGICLGYMYIPRTGSSGVSKYGTYIGGTGTPVNNSTEFSISTDNGDFGRYVTITCNSYAPLSTHEYVWFDIRKKES